MQEISPHVTIETAYAGVTLGAINGPHGLMLIDSPFRPDDVRSWRAALLNLGGGVDRLLINLDAHYDRTLGVRAMESTVVAHEKVAQIFRNRPVTFKVQGADTGADWELSNGMGSIRWAPPDITFSQGMDIHWGDSPLMLESRPGPASGASWAVLPDQGVVFLGDAVVANQTPFLASADLPAWIETLQYLQSDVPQDMILVSGRGGVVTREQVNTMQTGLEETHRRLEALAERKAAPEETQKLVDALLPYFPHPRDLHEHLTRRLAWGLQHYYARHYRLAAVDDE